MPPLRIVRGNKVVPEGEEDLRMDWLLGGQWVPIPFPVLFVLFDFLTENERILYPKGHPYYLANALIDAGERGWKAAYERLLEQRAIAAKRRAS
jgi:hypothetical protein